MSLKFPDISLTGEENPRKNPATKTSRPGNMGGSLGDASEELVT